MKEDLLFVAIVLVSVYFCDLNKNPENSRLNSIVKLPIKLATAAFLKITPKNRHMAAAAKLNKIINAMNLRNSGHCGTRPVIGYTTAPRMMGGIKRRGTMSKNTLAEKYEIGL